MGLHNAATHQKVDNVWGVLMVLHLAAKLVLCLCWRWWDVKFHDVKCHGVLSQASFTYHALLLCLPKMVWTMH